MATRAWGWIGSLSIHAYLLLGASFLLFDHHGWCCWEDPPVCFAAQPERPAPRYEVRFGPRSLIKGEPGSSDVDVLRPGMTHGGMVPRVANDFSPSLSADESAVTAALFWLARHQNSDGSWGGSRICCWDPRDPGPSPRLTALVLLAFRRAGYSEESGLLFGQVLKKASRWLTADPEAGDLWPFEEDLLFSQKVAADGCEDGSWDPSDEGRVYMTATNTLRLLSR